MRLLIILTIVFVNSLAFAEENWELAIVDTPNTQFTDFISTKGFGHQNPVDTVEQVCSDTDFAPLQLAIHQQDNSDIEVYSCDAWRSGNHTPEIRKHLI